MASQWGKWDGVLLGILLGLMIGIPTLASTVNEWLTDVIPESWMIFGSYSLALYLAILGAIIGLIAEKSK